jgi:hypothetical protein
MEPLKLPNRDADPSAEVDASLVYAKDVAGTSQAFVLTEDDRVSRLTPAVALVTPGESVSGAVASFPEETIELLPGEHVLDADIDREAATLRFRRGAILSVAVSRSIGSRSRLDFSAGGLIRVSADAVLTIAGPVTMPDTVRCFDVGMGGTVSFGSGSVSYLTPCHFGALLDDTTDASAAIQAAIDSLPSRGGVVRFPLGDMVSFGRIDIRRDNVVLEGMGWGSRLRLQTDVPAALLLFESDDTERPLHGCGIRSIRLSSGLASDVGKTAIDVHDAREFLAERIAVQPWFGGAAAGADAVDPWRRGSVGLRVRGRDAGLYRKLFLNADVPLLLDSNADRDIKDLDHHTFADLHLFSSVPPDPGGERPHPVIKVTPGFVMRNTSFTGYQAWVQGGLEWIDDAPAEHGDRREASNNVVIENVRAEELGRHPDVFAIDIQKEPGHPLHELTLRNCLTAGRGGHWSGVRAFGVENVVYDRTVRYEGAVTAIVADGIVDSGAPSGYVDGLRMSWSSPAQIAVGAGRCRSDDDRFDIEVTASLDGRLDKRGPNGRDRDPLVADTWYSVWVIDTSNHSADPALVVSTSVTDPLLPDGFDLKRRVGWIRSDAAKHVRRFVQRGSARGREIWYDEPLAALHALAGGASHAFTGVSLVRWLPPTAERVRLLAGFMAPGSGAALDSLELRPGEAVAADGPFRFLGAGRTFTVEMPCGTARRVEYKVTGAGDRADLWVLGFDDEL